MTTKIYGKKMAIADLIITSTWALLTFRFTPEVSYCILAIVLMRIALCFQMKQNSSWTLYSVIVFTLGYLFFPSYENGTFHAAAAIGFFIQHMIDPVSTAQIYNSPHSAMPHWWIEALWVALTIWITVLPILVTVLKKLFPSRIIISWKSVLLFGIVVSQSVWGYLVNRYTGNDTFITLLSIYPAIHWAVKYGRNRSAVQLLCDNRPLMLYLGFVSLFIAAMVIGLRNVFTLKMVGLLSFPAIYYVLISKSSETKSIPTVDTLLMIVCGYLYWICMDTDALFTIALLVLAVISVVIVACRLVRKGSGLFSGIALVLGTTLVLCPSLLGMNPYAVTESTHTRLYLGKVTANNGLYVTWSNGKYGLRDRWGAILDMKYDEFTKIDDAGNYIVVGVTDNRFGLNEDPRTHFGIFDLNRRIFVVDPNPIEIPKITITPGCGADLYDTDGYHFATLHLPGSYDGKYRSQPFVEAHYPKDTHSVDEFIGMGYNANVIIDDNNYWVEMEHTANPHTYRLFSALYLMHNAPVSPLNDLNYARAFKIFVDNDSYYKGNADKALTDIVSMLKPLTNEGSSAMGDYSDFCRLIESVRTSLDYDNLINTNSGYLEEYRAWHNMLGAIVRYYEFTQYATNDYETLFYDLNERTSQRYNTRRDNLATERQLLSLHEVEINLADSIKDITDIETIFAKYVDPANPYFYTPMWNEIRPALLKWIETRENISTRLHDDDIKKSYDRLTAKMIDEIYYDIKEMDSDIFVPILR